MGRNFGVKKFDGLLREIRKERINIRKKERRNKDRLYCSVRVQHTYSYAV
jgi:hypothetical protein